MGDCYVVLSDGKQGRDCDGASSGVSLLKLGRSQDASALRRKGNALNAGRSFRLLAVLCFFALIGFLGITVLRMGLMSHPEQLATHVKYSKLATERSGKYPISRGRRHVPEWMRENLDHIVHAEHHVIEAFEDFVRKFGKSYASTKEKAKRFLIFKKNYYYIQLHNAGKSSFKLAVNPYADMSWEEFKAERLSGYNGAARLAAGPRDPKNVDWELLRIDPLKLPAEVDWRHGGPDGSWECVTPVKNQAACGSCWAFSATGAVEGAYCKAHRGQTVSLSEQQMVDCSGPEGNSGCNGGLMDDAFKYIMDAGGLCSEDEYPYEARMKNCTSQKCQKVVTVSDYKDVPSKNEAALKAALALRGPISVAIEADTAAFQFYHEGVFDLPCGDMLNHGVLAVGYGTYEYPSGGYEDYWLVKNSWGPKWGDNGFIKIARHEGKEGECGILLQPSYPIVGERKRDKKHQVDEDEEDDD